MTSNVLKHIVLVVTQINKLSQDYGKDQQDRIRAQVPEILKESGISLNYSKIFLYQHGKSPNGLEELH